MGEGGSHDQPQDPCQVGRNVASLSISWNPNEDICRLVGVPCSLAAPAWVLQNQSLRQIEVVKLVPGYALGD